MEDHTNGLLTEIKTFAKTTPAKVEKTLYDCLQSLERMAQDKRTVLLSPDFAPQSLCFCILDENKNCVMNGGLIYHSSEDGFGNGFSVSINKHYGWSLHT